METTRARSPRGEISAMNFHFARIGAELFQGLGALGRAVPSSLLDATFWWGCPLGSTWNLRGHVR